jgi:glycine dehydrogenase subunit 1
VVDEVVGRTEFLTSVWGTPSSDHGRNQAWFEFCSMLGELVGLEFVGLPVYSWGCAIGNAVRMAARLNGRREVLVPAGMDPERLDVLRQYCEPEGSAGHIAVIPVAFEAASGMLDLADLKAKLSPRTAAVYIENPGFLGVVEARGAEIGRLARAAAAEFIVGVDPISLGVLAPPGDYGADIAWAPSRRSARACWRAVGRGASSPPATRSATRANTRRSTSPSRRPPTPASTASR